MGLMSSIATSWDLAPRLRKILRYLVFGTLLAVVPLGVLVVKCFAHGYLPASMTDACMVS